MTPTPPTQHTRITPRTPRDRVVLLLAQGFGSGLFPVAPGTVGSFLGLAWFLALVVPGLFWLYLTGTLAAIILGVRLCDRAERILDEKDPGSIVLDEIVAVPLAYLGWTTVAWLQTGGCSLRDLAQTGSFWWLLGVGFVLFRLFDAIKPWPIRILQRVKGGWGVVLDDLAAALCATVVLLWFTNAFR